MKGVVEMKVQTANNNCYKKTKIKGVHTSKHVFNNLMMVEHSFEDQPSMWDMYNNLRDYYQAVNSQLTKQDRDFFGTRIDFMFKIILTIIETLK